MRVIALVALPFLLSACGIPSAVLVTAYTVDGVSYVGTGKTVSDYALSAATKKDCSVLYGLTRGQLCEETVVPQVVSSDTRVPDRVPTDKVPEKAPNMMVAMIEEPVVLGGASSIDFDDAFANLETVEVSANIGPAKTPSEPPKATAKLPKASSTVPEDQSTRDVKSPRPPHAPLWTLVVGTFETEPAARDMVKRLRPEKALITVAVVQGKVAYRVSTEPFRISEADDRKGRVAHLELSDVHISRVCPAWMQDGRCIVLDRALSP